MANLSNTSAFNCSHLCFLELAEMQKVEIFWQADFHVKISVYWEHESPWIFPHNLKFQFLR